MSRPTTLYIFTTSARPDPYINTIAHVVNSYPISEIVYVGIVEHGYSESEGQAYAQSVNASVVRSLEALGSGTYLDSDRAVEVGAGHAKFYEDLVKRLGVIKVSALGIRWADLAPALKGFTQVQSIFDVTALKKNLLLDVVTTLISFGAQGVYSFELNISPTHGVADLYHALGSQGYTYRCLTDSQHVAAAQRRMRGRSISRRTVAIATGLFFLIYLIVDIRFPDSFASTVLVALAAVSSVVTLLLPFRAER